MPSLLEIKKVNSLGHIILNRPQALNALSDEMLRNITQALVDFTDDPKIKIIAISSTAEKAFCAGGDVRWMATTKNRQIQLDFFAHEYHLNGAIAKLNKPYVSLMNGLTMGGGVGIGLHGSYSIATESFVFAMPETAIGLFPDVGASYILSRLPQGIGMYLALTGQRVNAFLAHELGLVKYVIMDENKASCIEDLSNLSTSIDAYFAKLHINKPQNFGSEMAYIEQCFTQNSIEDIINALRDLNNPWAHKTLNTLNACSPLSLKVTFLQLNRAAGKSLYECLATDKKLVKHFLAGHDFYEGVRAMLIDKDKTPHWSPKTLAEISDKDVELYFS
ncbi:MAG: hypothetical protein A3F18_04435 [Legionellales bacterium RIFCSPHIGHO2_12_FULL_37_14]|nr:MAG: hypothetical protein A3F18_04435 [Legionellales bacterium RIFCSPHIGHO2_12_FULL_37_14]